VMIVLRNYLREAYLPNGNQVLMKYGSDGQLLRRRFYDASAEIWTTTNYLQSGAETIGDFDGSWNLQAYYVPGLMLDHIEIMHKGGADYYFVRDHLGSVRLVLDANADIVEKYEYSDYGKLTIKDANGTPLTQSAIGNRLAYTGREWDANLNLYYYRARWYDPTLARFTQKDIVHYTNRYIYVSSNPINYIDPLGLYDAYVHYMLTEQLALDMNISPDIARAIAWTDLWYDINPKTESILHPAEHFNTFGRDLSIEDALVKGARTHNIELFGSALHQLQDTYAHSGFLLQHIFAWLFKYDPDYYDPCTHRDQQMIDRVKLALDTWRTNNPNNLKELNSQIDELLKHQNKNINKYLKEIKDDMDKGYPSMKGIPH